MSRSNYCDDLDQWDLIRWRGAVKAAIRGRRGQAFLRAMRDALDAMPEKALIADEIVDDHGECCAIGAVALARGMDVSTLDPEDPDGVAAAFDVSQALVREITYMNDEWIHNPSAQRRWQYMRDWVERQIIENPPVPSP